MAVQADLGRRDLQLCRAPLICETFPPAEEVEIVDVARGDRVAISGGETVGPFRQKISMMSNGGRCR